MFNEELEVAAFEVRVLRQGSDIAVCAFYWNEDGHMELVTGCLSSLAVDAIEELLVCAKQAFATSDWKPVHIGNETTAEAKGGEPPF